MMQLLKYISYVLKCISDMYYVRIFDSFWVRHKVLLLVLKVILSAIIMGIFRTPLPPIQYSIWSCFISLCLCEKKNMSICTGGIFLRTIVPVEMVYFHSILDGVIRNLEYQYNVNKFKNNNNSLVTKKNQKHFTGIGTTELTS